MPASYTPPVPVPPPKPVEFSPGLTIVAPLSRRSTGPGLIVLVDDVAQGFSIKNGIPSPAMKWAEEGYCVVEILQKAWDATSNPIKAATEQIRKCEKVEPVCAIGLVCYEPRLWTLAAPNIKSAGVKAAVSYSSASSPEAPATSGVPTLAHVAGDGSADGVDKSYSYPSSQSSRFATPFTEGFHYSGEAVSHTRNLTFLKKHMGGPYFDLEDLWDEHTYYEFGNRSVENTMNTMVQEPYVNHIPTVTGGIGREELTAFYTNHFIFSNPEDAELELISRCVGIDRVVDEFVYKCTHNMVIDWLFPAIPPTNVYVEVPMTAIVNIRGDRLYHEHISWDHATALRQIGHLPDFVPFSQPATNGNGTHHGSDESFELRLPVFGKETVKKMRDKNSVPSNEMFGWGVRKS